MSKKNYIEHEERVKIIDGILENSHSWQWLVDYIEDNFDLCDITSWQEFLSMTNRLRDVYSFLIRIINNTDSVGEISSAVLADLFSVAKYYLGKSPSEDKSPILLSEFGKILYLVVFITKHENAENNTSYLYDFGIFTQQNYWQLVSINSLLENREEINELIKEITVLNWKDRATIFEDNLNKKEFSYSDNFFDKYGEYLLNVNAFSFQVIESDCLTWQEKYLLDMVKVSIQSHTFHPLFTNGTIETPDRKNWSIQVINKMLAFFHNPIASFVIESIKYVIYKETPSVNVREEHCRLLLSSLQKGEDIVHTFSFSIISSLFAESAMKDLAHNTYYKNMLIALQSYSSPEVLMVLSDNNIPISKTQRSILKEYAESYYKRVEAVSSANDFLSFIKDRVGIHYITNEQFNKIQIKFSQIITITHDIIIASLFYEYMLFLFDVNSKGVNIDKSSVCHAIIHTQELWEKEFYHEQSHNMQEICSKLSIPTVQVDTFVQATVKNPFVFASACMLTNPSALFDAMKDVSEHPLIYMVTRMRLTPTFPEKDVINIERHEIDQLLLQQIDNIKKNKGYKLLNIMDSNIYLSAVHEKRKNLIRLAASMIRDLKPIYEKVSSICEYPLLDYDSEIKLAHVVQLFPYLELQMRKLAKLTGFVPFKEQERDFLSYKDPSSILREIIEYVYKETDSFENIPDLLLIYHSLYNSNSLNIRNDCIHARQYLHGDSLMLALKISLLSILMLNKRIESLTEKKMDTE